MMHCAPIYMHQYCMCKILSSIKQWNTPFQKTLQICFPFQKTNLHRFENQGIDTLCAQNLSGALFYHPMFIFIIDYIMCILKWYFRFSSAILILLNLWLKLCLKMNQKQLEYKCPPNRLSQCLPLLGNNLDKWGYYKCVFKIVIEGKPTDTVGILW